MKYKRSFRIVNVNELIRGESIHIWRNLITCAVYGRNWRSPNICSIDKKHKVSSYNRGWLAIHPTRWTTLVLQTGIPSFRTTLCYYSYSVVLTLDYRAASRFPLPSARTLHPWRDMFRNVKYRCDLILYFVSVNDLRLGESLAYPRFRSASEA